ncbi:MAG: hypothetical protein AAGE76_06780 [Pseudomonadota bacterium]
MATTYRGTAVIEPESDAPQRGIFARLLRLIFGVVLGLAAAAYLIANPQLLTGLAGIYESRVDRLPEQYIPYAFPALMVVAVLLLYALRGVIFRNAIFYGAALGALLWVPFGNHILTAAPQVETAMPSLRPGLERLVQTDPRFGQVRNWAETRLPVETIASLGAQTATQEPQQ